jgi:hypothetical protein
VGGVIAFLLAAGLALYMVRRRRQQQAPTFTNGYGYNNPSDFGHGRTISDLSQATPTTGMGLGYSTFGNFSPTQTPLLPTNGTLHTHTSSVQSLSYFGSAAASVTYPVNSVGQFVTSHPTPPSPPLGPEDIIVPYTIPQSQAAPRQASDRKRAAGAVVLMYDNPVASPSHTDASIASRRPRFNPPEYTPYAEHRPEDSSSQINASSSRTRLTSPQG